MKYLPILFLVLSTTAFGQVRLPTNDAGQVQYQEIVRVGDGTRPARQVFDQVRLWSEQHYPAKNEAEQHDDQQHGILFVRSIYVLGERSVRYTLTVEAKIGRYRATITDLIDEADGLMLPLRPISSTAEDMKQASGNTHTNDELIEKIALQQVDLYQRIDEACRATLASLKTALTAGTDKKGE